MESIDIYLRGGLIHCCSLTQRSRVKERRSFFIFIENQDTPTASPDSAILVEPASVRATSGSSRQVGHLLPDLLLAF